MLQEGREQEVSEMVHLELTLKPILGHLPIPREDPRVVHEDVERRVVIPNHLSEGPRRSEAREVEGDDVHTCARSLDDLLAGGFAFLRVANGEDEGGAEGRELECDAPSDSRGRPCNHAHSVGHQPCHVSHLASTAGDEFTRIP